MARTTDGSTPSRRGLLRRRAGGERAPGRLAQLRQVYAMTRQADPAIRWWMLVALLVPAVLFLLLAVLTHAGVVPTVLWVVIGLSFGLLAAMFVLARRAESAAFAQIAGQPGAVGAALTNLRRGWNVETEPVAMDPRTKDLVFRLTGRPGVVLVTEGPVPRVNRLADSERKRIGRVLGANVPVHVVNAGDGEGQVPLRKLGRHIARIRPALTKDEVSQVSRRLRALGGVRPPLPKGIDPTRARPDRRATRGR